MNVALSPRQARTALDVLTGAVVVSVAIALAGLTWRIAGHAGTGAVTIPSGQSAPAAVPGIAPALALAPFGKPAANEAGTPTTLPLELKGVFAARPASASVAYIAVSGQPAQPFRVGDMVTNGATVQAVLRDRVILANGGRAEFLAFPDPTLSPEQRAAAVEQPGAPQPLVQGAVQASPPPPPAQTANLLQRYGATPVSGGMRIGDNAPPGLAPGDVIQSVNGTSLASPAAANSAFAAAQASGQAEVQLMRDGKRLTLTVPLR